MELTSENPPRRELFLCGICKAPLVFPSVWVSAVAGLRCAVCIKDEFAPRRAADLVP